MRVLHILLHKFLTEKFPILHMKVRFSVLSNLHRHNNFYGAILVSVV